MKLLDVARDHEDKIVRMQANIRGFLSRRHKNPVGGNIESQQKNKIAAPNESGSSAMKVSRAIPGNAGEDKAEKRDSDRFSPRGSKKAPGGAHMKDKGNIQIGDPACYELQEMPDHSTSAVRATEQRLGPFIFDN